MYTRLDVVKEAERLAREAALGDRMVFRKFIEAAEAYASAQGLVAGGAAATRLLLGSPVGLDSFQYEFFSERPGPDARGLADAMYAADPQGRGRHTKVLTRIQKQRLQVFVDERLLLTVVGLPVHRGVRVAEVLTFSRRPALFAPVQLACMGAEMQLIEVYRVLCSPAEAPQWPEALEAEERLRELFEREVGAKLAKSLATGLAKSLAPGLAPERALALGARWARGAPERAPSARARVVRRLDEAFASGGGRVLVGGGALALMRGAPPDGERLQIVSAGDLEEEAREAARVAGAELQWTTNALLVPGDARLQRLTLHLVRDGRREPVMDIFSAAQYSLVPYVSAPASRLKIGTLFALMRFRLIDLWTMQLLVRMGAASKDYVKEVLSDILSDYREAAALFRSRPPPARLLPETYVGRLEDPTAAARREALRRAAPYEPPYLPAARAARAAAWRRGDPANEAAAGLGVADFDPLEEHDL